MGKQPVTPSASCPISQAFAPPPIAPGQPANDEGKQVVLAQSPGALNGSLQLKWFGSAFPATSIISQEFSVRPALPNFFIYCISPAATADIADGTVSFLNGGVIVSQVKVATTTGVFASTALGYVSVLQNTIRPFWAQDPNGVAASAISSIARGNASFLWSAQCDKVRFDLSCFTAAGAPTNFLSFLVGVQQSLFL